MKKKHRKSYIKQSPKFSFDVNFESVNDIDWVIANIRASFLKQSLVKQLGKTT